MSKHLAASPRRGLSHGDEHFAAVLEPPSLRLEVERRLELDRFVFRPRPLLAVPPERVTR